MSKTKSGKEALDELIRSVSAKEDLLIPLSEKDRKERDKRKADKPLPAAQLDPVEVRPSPNVVEPPPSKIEHLADLMRHLSLVLDRSKIAEFVEIQSHPFHQALKNIVRGFLMGIGMALAFAGVWWGIHSFTVPTLSAPQIEIPKVRLHVPGFLKKIPSFHH